LEVTVVTKQEYSRNAMASIAFVIRTREIEGKSSTAEAVAEGLCIMDYSVVNTCGKLRLWGYRKVAARGQLHLQNYVVLN